MYLLDTNTLIYFFKGEGQVAKHLFALSPPQIAIPSIVIYELEVGIAKSTSPQKRKEQLNSLIQNVTIIPFDLKEAHSSANIRANLERSGNPIGPIDTLIAGCALAHNHTLVTQNLKEFEKVKGLKTENWF
jgi:tRNA(fMet)-specific endonuclease VapC